MAVVGQKEQSIHVDQYSLTQKRFEGKVAGKPGSSFVELTSHEETDPKGMSNLDISRAHLLSWLWPSLLLANYKAEAVKAEAQNTNPVSKLVTASGDNMHTDLWKGYQIFNLPPDFFAWDNSKQN